MIEFSWIKIETFGLLRSNRQTDTHTHTHTHTSMLTTKQLLNITKNHSCTEDTILGVYSIDRVPKHINFYPSGYITNNRPSSHGGEHWISLFFPGRFQAAEMFCSLGNAPHTYDPKLNDILKSNGNGTFKFSTRQVQSDMSRACGYFALYYCDLRSRGLSYELIMNNMSEVDFDKNENIVKGYVTSHMLD